MSKVMAAKRKPKSNDSTDLYLYGERVKGKKAINKITAAGGLDKYAAQGRGKPGGLREYNAGLNRLSKPIGGGTPARTSSSSGGNGALYTRLMGHLGSGLKRGSK